MIRIYYWRNSIQNDTTCPAAVILRIPIRLPNAVYNSPPISIIKSTFKNIFSANSTQKALVHIYLRIRVP